MSNPPEPKNLPEQISFWKFSASANDFIVLDNRDKQFSEHACSLARALCKRRFSVGADGLILVENSDGATVRIRFFNPDGHEFNTCGNGGRCAARFTHLLISPQSDLTMETNLGIIKAGVTGSSVALQFVPPTEVKLNITAEVDGQSYVGHFVQLGDPHFVTEQPDIRHAGFVSVARKLRHCDSFAPAGANIHFIEVLSSQRIRIRTYERGIEGETLACGSGCIAAAISTHAADRTSPPVTFEPQSGIPLIVQFQPGGAFADLYLEGDARLIYRGELNRDALSGFRL